MAKDLIILALFSGVSVATSVFLASFFFLNKNKSRFRNRLLGFLFIAIGLRIAKSIVHFIFIEVLSIGLALGFLGLSMIGALLYLYIRSFYSGEETFRKIDFIHFLYPVTGFIFCLFTEFNNVVLLYQSATALMVFYILFSLGVYFRKRRENTSLGEWIIRLIFSVLFIWAAFVYQHVAVGIVKYAYATIVASLAVYFAFVNALRFPLSSTRKSKVNLPKATVAIVKMSFEEEKIYLQSSMTLTKFSIEKNIPSYLVSESVKKLYNKSFPEAINSFRIKDFTQSLLNSKDSFLKIENLAYEYGFGSPSSFYAAFKKEKGMSPKEFQKKNC